MSETANTIVIERNGVKLEFKDKEIKRGDSKGTTYPAPVVTEQNLDNVLKFLGADVLISMLTAFINRHCQGWANEATNDEGLFNEEQFAEFATSMSARGESIKDLKARILEITNTEIPSLNPFLEDGSPNMEDLKRLAKIKEEIQAIKLAIATKSKKTAEDIEAEKSM